MAKLPEISPDEHTGRRLPSSEAQLSKVALCQDEMSLCLSSGFGRCPSVKVWHHYPYPAIYMRWAVCMLKYASVSKHRTENAKAIHEPTVITTPRSIHVATADGGPSLCSPPPPVPPVNAQAAMHKTEKPSKAQNPQHEMNGW